MPLLPPVSRYSTSSSKSAGAPSRQIRNVFWFGIAPGLVSPTMAPFLHSQYAGSPSQPFNVLPSKIGVGLCAETNDAPANNSSASLWLRNAQAKRIQCPVVSTHVDAAAA